MIRAITEQIITPIVEALPWVDVFGGVAIIATKEINRDGDEITFPVSVHTPENCPPSDEVILCPDSKKQAVLWIEEVSDVTTVVDPRFAKRSGMLNTQTIRILGWVNGPAIGETGYHFAYGPEQDLIRVLHNKTINGFQLQNIGQGDPLPLNRVKIRVTSQLEKDHSVIFNSYTFAEEQKWFVDPYDFFAIDLEVSWLVIEECMPVFVANSAIGCPPGFTPAECGPVVSECEGNLIQEGVDGGACLTINELPDLGRNGIFDVANNNNDVLVTASQMTLNQWKLISAPLANQEDTRLNLFSNADNLFRLQFSTSAIGETKGVFMYPDQPGTLFTTESNVINTGFQWLTNDYQFAIQPTGQLVNTAYGSGNFTGTVFRNLAVDGGGNFIQPPLISNDNNNIASIGTDGGVRVLESAVPPAVIPPEALLNGIFTAANFWQGENIGGIPTTGIWDDAPAGPFGTERRTFMEHNWRIIGATTDGLHTWSPATLPVIEIQGATFRWLNAAGQEKALFSEAGFRAAAPSGLTAVGTFMIGQQSARAGVGYRQSTVRHEFYAGDAGEGAFWNSTQGKYYFGEQNALGTNLPILDSMPHVLQLNTATGLLGYMPIVSNDASNSITQGSDGGIFITDKHVANSDLEFDGDHTTSLFQHTWTIGAGDGGQAKIRLFDLTLATANTQLLTLSGLDIIEKQILISADASNSITQGSDGGVFLTAGGGSDGNGMFDFGNQGGTWAVTEAAITDKINLTLTSGTADRLTLISSQGLGREIQFGFPALPLVTIKTSNSALSLQSSATATNATIYSSVGIGVRIGGTSSTKVHIYANGAAGQVDFPQYGVGTFEEAAAYNLGVTAAGKIVEVAGGGGGDNGLFGAINDDGTILVDRAFVPPTINGLILEQTNALYDRVLTVQSETNSARIQFNTSQGVATSGGRFYCHRSRGTLAAPTDVQSGDRLFQINGAGWGNGNWRTGSLLVMSTGSTWNGTNSYHGLFEIKVTASGSTSTVTQFEVDGSDIRLNAYGVGAKTGTPAYDLQVQADGKIIEGAAGMFSAGNQGATWGVTDSYIDTNTVIRFLSGTDRLKFEHSTNNGRYIGFGFGSLPFFQIQAASGQLMTIRNQGSTGTNNIYASGAGIRLGGTSSSVAAISLTGAIGQVDFPQYGTGTFDAAPVRNLGVDVTGKIVTYIGAGASQANQQQIEPGDIDISDVNIALPLITAIGNVHFIQNPPGGGGPIQVSGAGGNTIDGSATSSVPNGVGGLFISVSLTEWSKVSG